MKKKKNIYASIESWGIDQYEDLVSLEDANGKEVCQIDLNDIINEWVEYKKIEGSGK